MKPTTTNLILGIACLCLCLTPLQAQTAYSWTTIIDTNTSDLGVPTGIALDKLGNLYVLDSGTYTLHKFVPNVSGWVGSTIAGLSGSPGSSDGTNSDIRFAAPTIGFGGIAIDATGNIYVADEGNSTIRRLTQIGTDWVSTTIAGLAGNPGSADGTNSDARFAQAAGVTVDAAGNLYVSASANDAIRRIVQSGTNWITTTLPHGLIGNADGTNTAIQIWAPWAIALDSNGSLYISDVGNNTIRKLMAVGTDWVCTTIAGKPGSHLLYGTQDGTNSAIRFGFGGFGPRGLTVDNAGNVFVADSGNSTIRLLTQIATNWVSSTVGGKGLSRGNVDGVGTAARFNTPSGVVVDSNGNVYVSDSNNSEIRMGRPVPLLLAVPMADRFVCSWPTAFSNFVLETTESLAPGAAWIALTNGIGVLGDSFVVTNSIDNPATFFRLREH